MHICRSTPVNPWRHPSGVSLAHTLSTGSPGEDPYIIKGEPFHSAQESLELFLRLSENRLSAKIILRACKSDRKDRYVFMLKKEIVAA